MAIWTIWSLGNKNLTTNSVYYSILLGRYIQLVARYLHRSLSANTYKYPVNTTYNIFLEKMSPGGIWTQDPDHNSERTHALDCSTMATLLLWKRISERGKSKWKGQGIDWFVLLFNGWMKWSKIFTNIWTTTDWLHNSTFSCWIFKPLGKIFYCALQCS